MARIHLALAYKSDAMLRVLIKDIDGEIVTGATGTYDLKDSGDSSLINGSMSEEGDGWYYFNIPDTLSVTPGDILKAEVTMTSGGYQCYGEYEIHVKVDRR